jgi:hypothetical protein
VAVAGQIVNHHLEQEGTQFLPLVQFTAQRLHFGMQDREVFQQQFKFAAQFRKRDVRMAPFHRSLHRIPVHGKCGNYPMLTKRGGGRNGFLRGVLAMPADLEEISQRFQPVEI